MHATLGGEICGPLLPVEVMCYQWDEHEDPRDTNLDEDQSRCPSVTKVPLDRGRVSWKEVWDRVVSVARTGQRERWDAMNCYEDPRHKSSWAPPPPR
eukprot:COSAG01_NODE_197_length_22333_cov_45.774759_14_plen_97_part_00